MDAVMASLDWQIIERAAAELGIKEKAVEKWRQRGRGVPPKWWLALVQRSKGKVSFEALDSFNRERAAEMLP
jgi:hypothetical protein